MIEVDGPVENTVRFDGATHVASGGELTVLTSKSAERELIRRATKIVPVSRPIKTANRSELSLAPYSLNILRLNTKDDLQ
jgi:hypothetical protein